MGAMAAAGAAAGEEGWIELFDGKSLNGWRANEGGTSWKVRGGEILADGARSHLFYTGPVRSANFRNFELEVEANAAHLCNSGVYFHTAYQESGWPQKGFEVQINNTAEGEGTYRERKKTGSLYAIRNIYKQMLQDDAWFRMHIAVRGKNVQVRLNGMLVVDYNEPTPPVIPEGERERFLDRGTFALQCHDAGSKARFRSIRVRPLADDMAASGIVVADEVYRRIVRYGAANIPMVDYHVHLKGGLTLEQALAKSRKDGLQYGIAVNCGKGFPVQDDEGARRFIDTLKGQSVFVAMQAEGREWTQMFSREAASRFDYIFTDSMTWTDNSGRRMRLWIPEEVGTIADPQEFMETLVERATGLLEREPIDIYVNPTYLPDSLAKDYDRLWTEGRMRKVVKAAADNGVAIELNDRYKLPSAQFVQMAKSVGCKFTFGTNNSGPEDLGRSEYGLAMVERCQLQWQDFFVPGAWGDKAVQRKPAALQR